MTFINATIKNCFATAGGAIRIYYTQMANTYNLNNYYMFKNTTFQDNKAVETQLDGSGGAIYIDSTSAQLTYPVYLHMSFDNITATNNIGLKNLISKAGFAWIKSYFSYVNITGGIY